MMGPHVASPGESGIKGAGEYLRADQRRRVRLLIEPVGISSCAVRCAVSLVGWLFGVVPCQPNGDHGHRRSPSSVASETGSGR
jgi:hypothetical protein